MPLTPAQGHVTRVNGPVVHLRGLPDAARYDFVEVGQGRLPGEITTIDRTGAVAQLYEYSGSLRVGEPVRTAGEPLSVDLGPGLLGRIYDGLLRPLDVEGDFLPPRPLNREAGATTRWPIREPRPVARRISDVEPFHTGQRVLDLLAPIARGSSASVIGGFGEGKTMLLEQLAKWGDADVIVYVGCGERGNELTDLIDELTHLVDPRTGDRLIDRTIILANTSNMPVMAREASIYAAATVAEYYRDMGHDVVVIADSTSRWAEAQRELVGRTGAIPAEEGYPADLPAALAAFYQRAGRVETLDGREGSVTIVTSVSPAGGDLTEPVSAHTERFVQAMWTLDRDLAYARHYPAVSWRHSFSRSADQLGQWYTSHGDPDWSTRRARLGALLSEADRLRDIADLVGVTALPAEERLVLVAGRLARLAVLQQNAMSTNDASCAADKQAALADAVLTVHDENLQLARRGLPASVIETFDFGPLIRAKDETGPADAAGVRRTVAGIVDELRRRGEP